MIIIYISIEIHILINISNANSGNTSRDKYLFKIKMANSINIINNIKTDRPMHWKRKRLSVIGFLLMRLDIYLNNLKGTNRKVSGIGLVAIKVSAFIIGLFICFIELPRAIK